MKRNSLLIAVGILLAGLLAGAEMVEKILVRVNDRLITNSEFQRRMVAATHAPGASTDVSVIKREVLQDLIKEKLLEERAREMSVSASDEEIETAVERVKRQYNLATDQEFDAALATSNMTREDLKRQMRQTIILQKVIGRDVTSKLDVSEDMLRLVGDKGGSTESRNQARLGDRNPFSGQRRGIARESRGAAGRGAHEAHGGNLFRGTGEGILRGKREGPRRRPGVGLERGASSGPRRGRLRRSPAGISGARPHTTFDPPVPGDGSQTAQLQTSRRSQDLKKRIGENLYEKRFAMRRQAPPREYVVYDPGSRNSSREKELRFPDTLTVPDSPSFRFLLRRRSFTRLVNLPPFSYDKEKVSWTRVEFGASPGGGGRRGDCVSGGGGRRGGIGLLDRVALTRIARQVFALDVDLNGRAGIAAEPDLARLWRAAAEACARRRSSDAVKIS